MAVKAESGEKVRSYKNLMVWQRSMKFVTEIYRLTQAFPKSEIYDLTNQIRRAAVSIPSNIVEGHAYRSDNYLKHHLTIAIGSASELETQHRIASQIGFLSSEDFPLAKELDEIIKMLHGLVRRVEGK